mgnify:CR=1 FL=1
MKKFISFFMILMLISVLTFASGSWTNNAVKITGFAGEKQGSMLIFTCSVDSVDTLTSGTFSLAKYDGNYFTVDTAGTSHFQEVPYAYIATSALGSPKLTCYIQGSYDQSNWFNVDTLCTDLTSESLAIGTAQLFRYHVPYYRTIVYGVALNRSDTVFDFRFYLFWDLDQRDR